MATGQHFALSDRIISVPDIFSTRYYPTALSTRDCTVRLVRLDVQPICGNIHER